MYGSLTYFQQQKENIFSHKAIEYVYFWKQNAAFYKYLREEDTNLIN